MSCCKTAIATSTADGAAAKSHDGAAAKLLDGADASLRLQDDRVLLSAAGGSKDGLCFTFADFAAFSARIQGAPLLEKLEKAESVREGAANLAAEPDYGDADENFDELYERNYEQEDDRQQPQCSVPMHLFSQVCASQAIAVYRREGDCRGFSDERRHGAEQSGAANVDS